MPPVMSLRQQGTIDSFSRFNVKIIVYFANQQQDSILLPVNEQMTFITLKEKLYCQLFLYHPSQKCLLSYLVETYLELKNTHGETFSKNESRKLQALGMDSKTQLECNLPMESNLYSMRARILNMRNRTATTFLYAQKCLKQEHSEKLPNELGDIVGRYCSSVCS